MMNAPIGKRRCLPALLPLLALVGSVALNASPAMHSLLAAAGATTLSTLPSQPSTNDDEPPFVVYGLDLKGLKGDFVELAHARPDQPHAGLVLPATGGLIIHEPKLLKGLAAGVSKVAIDDRSASLDDVAALPVGRITRVVISDRSMFVTTLADPNERYYNRVSESINAEINASKNITKNITEP